MSSASLAVAPRIHPDSARIAAISAAIALNLAVIVVASRPTAPAPLPTLRQISPVALIDLVKPPPEVPPPPEIEMKPLPHPPTAPVVHTPPAPISTPLVVPTAEGRVEAPPVIPPTLLPASDMPGTGVAAPVEASLAYRSAPLKFPRQALMHRMQGTVLLRVLVDETGKPMEVKVEQGSGYALLDRSAREQVLAGWEFQPAMVNGKAVRAWARVPVTFSLRQ